MWWAKNEVGCITMADPQYVISHTHTHSKELLTFNGKHFDLLLWLYSRMKNVSVQPRRPPTAKCIYEAFITSNMCFFFFQERVRVALYSKCGACYFKHLFFDVWCKIIGPDHWCQDFCLLHSKIKRPNGCINFLYKHANLAYKSGPDPIRISSPYGPMWA